MRYFGLSWFVDSPLPLAVWSAAGSEQHEGKLLLGTSLRAGLCSVDIGALIAFVASVGLPCVVFPSSPAFSSGNWTAAVKILCWLRTSGHSVGSYSNTFWTGLTHCWFIPDPLRGILKMQTSVEFIAWLTVLFWFCSVFIKHSIPTIHLFYSWRFFFLKKVIFLNTLSKGYGPLNKRW